MSKLLIPGILSSSGSTTNVIDPGVFAVGKFNKFNSFVANNVSKFNTDDSFDSTFIGSLNGIGSIYHAATQSDGKIILVGSFSYWYSIANNSTITVGNIVRLNQDGSLDTTFIAGTGTNSPIEKVIVQPGDDKIIICGGFTQFNGVTTNRIVRLNANGTRDNTFNIGTGLGSTANDMVLQADGKIVVVGAFVSYNSTTVGRIVRINTDGTRDSSWPSGTANGFNATPQALALQADGKLIIALTSPTSTYRGVATNCLCRINSDGTRDTTFNGVANTGSTTVNSILSLSDNSVLVGGSFIQFNGVSANRIVKLNSDGSTDTSFNTGTGFNNIVHYISAVDADILVVGRFTEYNGTARNFITKLNSDGSIKNVFNSGFNTNAPGYTAELLTGIPLANGGFIVGGLTRFYDGEAIDAPAIVNLLMDGTLNPNFQPGIGFSSFGLSNVGVEALDVYGSFIYAGSSTTLIYQNAPYSEYLVKITGTGDLVPSFNLGAGIEFSSGGVRCCKIQNDNKILVGGSFDTYDGSSANSIIRLNPNGSRDNTFDIGTGFSDNLARVINIDILSNNFIAVALTNAYQYNLESLQWENFAILTADGLDGSFSGWVYPEIIGQVNQFCLNSEKNSIFIYGYFTDASLEGLYGGSSFPLIRLSETGEVENIFPNFLGVSGILKTMAVHADGSVLLGGDFTAATDSTMQYTVGNIVKIDSLGNIDNQFTAGSIFNGPVEIIKVQADGKIIVGGTFSTHANQVVSNIARLNSDGSLDTSWSDVQLNGTVNNIVIL